MTKFISDNKKDLEHLNPMNFIDFLYKEFMFNPAPLDNIYLENELIYKYKSNEELLKILEKIEKFKYPKNFICLYYSIQKY